MTSVRNTRLSRALAGAVVFSLSFLFSTAAVAFPLKPEADLTPGEYCTRGDKDYAEDRYEEGIPYCERNVSRELKSRVYDAYGIPEKCRANYTVDHLIPLSMGGNNEFENLWPEAKVLKATRQNLELDTYHELRDGKIDQKTAIDRILDEKLNPPKQAAKLKIGGGCD